MVHGVNLGVTAKYVLLSMTMYRRQMDFCAIHLCLPNGFFPLENPGNIWDVYLTFCSQYSDSPRPARSGDRTPVEARFSAPVQNGPAGHPCFYTMDTRSLSRWEKCRGMALTSHSPSSVEVKEKWSYTCTPSLGLHGLFQGELLSDISHARSSHPA